MFTRNALLAAAAVVGFTCSPAFATTYDALSHVENGSPEHSVWFSPRNYGVKNPLVGASGDKKNHFLFENAPAGAGTFEVDEDTATLTGIVKNAAGDAFELALDFVLSGPADRVKNPDNVDTSDWSFYDLAVGTLTSLTDGIASFDVELRGNGLKAQLGVGANDKDADLFGFSTWITLNEQNCTSDDCQQYTGDINIVLEENDGSGGGVSPVPLPAAGWLLIGAVGGLGALKRRRKS